MLKYCSYVDVPRRTTPAHRSSSLGLEASPGVARKEQRGEAAGRGFWGLAGLVWFGLGLGWMVGIRGVHFAYMSV